jgi:hypothetical protein
MSSGWSGGGPRAAGTVADLSGGQRSRRLPGINDFDSDSSGPVHRDAGGEDHPATPDSAEESGPAAPDSPVDRGGVPQVHSYIYLHIALDTYRYTQIQTDTYLYLQSSNVDRLSFSTGSCTFSVIIALLAFEYNRIGRV